MSVAKVIEVISKSKISFEDAIEQGVSRTSETVKEVTGAWVKDQSVEVSNGKIVSYTVMLKITFVLKAKGKSK
jgi:flavin-binding protein dodecin